MSERETGHYWVRVLDFDPEVALWDADDGVWWCANDPGGYVTEAVAVLSPRLVPPAPEMHAFTPGVQTCISGEPPPIAPVPRVSVRWAVPPCEGEADTSGVLHAGGRA